MMNTTKNSYLTSKLEFPMFDQTIYLSLFDVTKFNIFKKFIKKEFNVSIENVNKAACCYNLDGNNILILIHDKTPLKDIFRLIVHESVHVVNFIKENTEITANDEFDACMISFIVDFFSKIDINSTK